MSKYIEQQKINKDSIIKKWLDEYGILAETEQHNCIGCEWLDEPKYKSTNEIIGSYCKRLICVEDI